jgi:hypothetical protein
VSVGAFSIGLMKVSTISLFSLMKGALEKAALRRLTKREGRRQTNATSERTESRAAAREGQHSMMTVGSLFLFAFSLMNVIEGVCKLVQNHQVWCTHAAKTFDQRTKLG